MKKAERQGVRMFTGEPGTVRWEANVGGTRSLELHVSGPGDDAVSYALTDPLALVQCQSDHEQALLKAGYVVSPVNDRRDGYDRRRQSRPVRERRRG